MRCATSRRTSSALTGSTPGVLPSSLPSSAGSSQNRRSPCAPDPQSCADCGCSPVVAVLACPLAAAPAAGCSRSRRSRRSRSPILAGQRRIARQRQSFGVEIVVDLAVAGGVPAPVVRDRRRFLARLVVAQQMADFVNQQRRVLFDACASPARRRCSRAASAHPPPCCRSDRSRPGSG